MLSQSGSRTTAISSQSSVSLALRTVKKELCFMRRMWRVAVYLWVAPSSSVGLLATTIALLQGGRSRWVNGVLEVTGPKLLRFLSHGAPVNGGISAITLGHVVVGQSEQTLAETRGHERVHVRQYERWGPFFIPAYLLASAWMRARGKDPYLDNPFEVEAYAVDGYSR